MKRFLPLAAIFATSLYAETEAEFIARIAAAWDSKNPDKVIALYGDPQKLDPEFVKAQRARLELEFKTRQFKSAHVVPFLPPDNTVNISAGIISFLPKDVTRCVSVEMYNEEVKRSGWSVIPIAKDKEGRFSYATAEERRFEWKGAKPSQYGITMRYVDGDSPCPGIIAVVETCGYTNWEKVGGSFGGFRAHKILQLIVPPTTEAKAITFEITKDDAKPFFEETIDTSKGAIIPIESAKP